MSEERLIFLLAYGPFVVLGLLLLGLLVWFYV
jgi:hypothetical protein